VCTAPLPLRHISSMLAATVACVRPRTVARGVLRTSPRSRWPPRVSSVERLLGDASGPGLHRALWTCGTASVPLWLRVTLPSIRPSTPETGHSAPVVAQRAAGAPAPSPDAGENTGVVHRRPDKSARLSQSIVSNFTALPRGIVLHIMGSDSLLTRWLNAHCSAIRPI